MPTAICPECKASHGFAIAWNDTRGPVLEVLEKYKTAGKQKKIVTVGHSLGGAIAGLAAGHLRQMGYYTDMVCFTHFLR